MAEKDGDIRYSDLSFEGLKARFLEVCDQLRALGTVENLDDAIVAITSLVEPKERMLPYQIEGHGTIFPNASVLLVCGFSGIGEKPFSRFHEGEEAHIEQIVFTSKTIFDEREENPPSLANQIYPRSPDLNLYCPATYEIKTAISLRSDLDRELRRKLEMILRILEKQSGYSFEIASEAKQKAFLGITREEHQEGKKPEPNPVMRIRQQEIWLGTEVVSCLAASEIAAVLRLPNRMNLTRGMVSHFSQHYRSHRPQMLKRSELFNGVQRAIAAAFPDDLRALIDRSKDGIRIIADAHIEWLNVRGIPLRLRYNVSRIPVTPGNLFIETLSSLPPILSTPDDFHDILVISGLSEEDEIARQFKIAFDIFGKQWRDKLRITFVRASSQQEFINAINAFDGMMMIFDGHGSHSQDSPGVLWLGNESVDVWSLRGAIHRPPPIIILSACDTHATGRNHATVANGFLALGSRSVLASVFPLHASHAAMFAARLLFRVSSYIPGAIEAYERSLTWLEVVSGMLRRQLVTDILRHLEAVGQIVEGDSQALHHQLHGIIDSDLDDPFLYIRRALLEYGIPEEKLDRETHIAIAASSTISYVHLGRPETILINTPDMLQKLAESSHN